VRVNFDFICFTCTSTFVAFELQILGCFQKKFRKKCHMFVGEFSAETSRVFKGQFQGISNNSSRAV
jgi:hypothetical protein